MIGGQRDVAYSDIDGILPRATEEGEQAQMQPEQAEPLPEQILNDETNKTRPPGKLYGKSLIDDPWTRESASFYSIYEMLMMVSIMSILNVIIERIY